MITIAQAYRQLVAALSTIYDFEEARSVARIVFEDALKINNLQRTDALASHQLGLLSRLQSRLFRGEPVQYVVGEAEFYGFRFKVDSRVLIPRQETEELVHWILETLEKSRVGAEPPIRVLDIGAGSGCIPIVLKKRRPLLEVSAVDISRDALELAAGNARRLETDIHFSQTDILDSSQWDKLGTFDLIVSNPPYIPPSESKLVPSTVQDFEPHQALFTPGDDPLIFYRMIATFAARHLHPGGLLFFEVNEFHAQPVGELLESGGFCELEIRRDINGKERMVRGKLC